MSHQTQSKIMKKTPSKAVSVKMMKYSTIRQTDISCCEGEEQIVQKLDALDPTNIAQVFVEVISSGRGSA